MNLSRIGLDLAKQVFQVHGVDRHEHVVCRRQLKRAQVRDFFRQLPPCLVAMEACGSAHYWARELRELGHTVRLIAPQFVKPYVKGDKHDAHDAEAICEAASRPSMRYVPVKSAEQQAVQSMHRVRSRLVRARTALCNEVRGLLGEFGLIATRRGRAATMALLETVMTTEPASLPAPMGELLRELKDELQTLEARIARLERQIQAHVRGDARIQRLLAVDGIGPISASAVAASAGDARQFRTGRQFAAWLGLVPRQHSTGGQQRLGNISKRGDTYLRTLLIHGARAVVRCCANKTDARSRWLQGLLQRRPANVVAVALANKNARILWALLSRETCYRPG
ncbi:TPA: IS110-like element ISPa11 family transposase [Pseudomonas aeruginosa]|uniref:IS110-like element ISPa11 family transposase n=1 Tax=Pseudomonas aeruginosa TaxID=287 RepID=UPI001BC909ED|nr:IS110-like element ISPa11 family transposase [Pseudomonas aeruginosa]HBP0870963.1 IS110-like element ISPa11 family transposase [Pseudomonas aeruginosa]HBP1818879.1 IS110-like element ISPa11 family transposase [Pseudomonas aeruginosa]